MRADQVLSVKIGCEIRHKITVRWLSCFVFPMHTHNQGCLDQWIPHTMNHICWSYSGKGGVTITCWSPRPGAAYVPERVSNWQWKYHYIKQWETHLQNFCNPVAFILHWWIYFPQITGMRCRSSSVLLGTPQKSVQIMQVIIFRTLSSAILG